MLAIVTIKPLILIGVSGSWYTYCDAVMVRTSLKMPQMDSVTTDVRFSSAYSALIMQKAIIPGNSMSRMPTPVPFAAASREKPDPKGPKPSTGMARRNMARKVTGVRKKRVEKGLEVAGLRRRRIWVSAQRKPEKKAERMIRMKPSRLKKVSPATIMTTPAVMVRIMRISFRDGVSRRKIKAHRRTKARAEDLHIAMGRER